MSRKMCLKFCSKCGKSFRSRRSMKRHQEGYTGKYNGKVMPACVAVPETPEQQVVVEFYGYYPNAVNVGLRAA